MKVRMLRNLLGVEKLGKAAKKDDTKLFAPVDVTHNVGVIRYVGEALKEKFSEGQKVYVGNKREEIRMNGADIMVMEEDNVIAIEEASDEDQKTEVSQA